MPLDKRQQKNVYLGRAPDLGPGAKSHLMSYNLEMLSERDCAVLMNRSGNAYKYRVTWMCVTEPDGGRLPDTVRSRDTVTPQTSCPHPTHENRFILRVDRA